jgi:hypothetical protein
VTHYILFVKILYIFHLAEYCSWTLHFQQGNIWKVGNERSIELWKGHWVPGNASRKKTHSEVGVYFV